MLFPRVLYLCFSLTKCGKAERKFFNKLNGKKKFHIRVNKTGQIFKQLTNRIKTNYFKTNESV